MQYVDYGKTGMKVSRFGFGCMRFPKNKVDGISVIDQDETTRMVRYAIEKGVNYFDTAHVYGGSEEALGIALEGGLREKVFIVGKNPVWSTENREDMERLLDEELARLQTTYLDVEFLHALSGDSWQKCLKMGALEFLDDMKKAGKIKHAGFSFHGHIDDFKKIIDAYNWDIVQIQLNFMDVKHQAGVEGMRYATAKGIPVVVMEPLRGGALVDKLPPAVEAAYAEYKIKRSPAEWAFRWLIDQSEVVNVLSGVSTMAQLEENIQIFSENGPGCMTADDKALMEKVVLLFKEHSKVGCTGCGYCMPCPSGVDIPGVFKLYNDTALNEYREKAKVSYAKMDSDEKKSSALSCTECGLCEPQCPQDIPIINKLKEAHKELTLAS
jgi:predicted aldo/keto reductase-like oxidoreductase